MSFTNWSGAVTASPTAFHRPRTLDEVSTIVAGLRDGEQLRIVGAGHSFSPVAASDSQMMNLDHLSGLVSVDAPRRRARFLAGTRLRDVPALLAPHGLALPNQGDVDPQSLAGATSTGTHGTGLAFTGFAGAVTGLTLITPDGASLRLSADERPELFDVARLSLGALGVVTEIEYQCVPAFDLLADEGPEDLDEVLDTFTERARAVDHLEFFWFPYTRDALVKTNTRLAPGEAAAGGEPPSRGRVRRFLTEEFLDNAGLAAVCFAGSKAPSLAPRLNRFAARQVSARRYRAAAHEVFVSPRRVKFFEMEYAVPLGDGPEVVRELRQLVERRGWNVTFPIEYRCAAADDVPLSTAYGRESVYIAVHRYRGDAPDDYFPEAERIFRAAGGRPHWGKQHTLVHEDLMELYPRLGDFTAVRDQLDPGRKCSSPYLETLLG